MSNRQIPKKVVIVGGGTAGWMSACLMHKEWSRDGADIVLVESSSVPTVGVGEGSTPFLRDFFSKIGVAEEVWMPRCNATYKCGISFPGWRKEGGGYFHPFYSALDAEQAPKFFQACNHRRRGYYAPSSPDLYFVTSELARSKKAPISIEPLPFDHDYGYHFDAGLLGEFLKELALSRGVLRIEATLVSVVVDEAGVSGLVTDESSVIEGDVFVDCSGLKGMLLKDALAVPYLDYSQYLFNDSAVAIQSHLPVGEGLSSETVSVAIDHGWVWQIPLRSRSGNGYVYSSKYLTEDKAESELRDYLGMGDSDVKALHLHWNPGRLERSWEKNCVAIGLSMGFLEPLEAAMLHLIQYGIENFISLYQQGESEERARDEFNRRVNLLIDGTRDYLQLHYLLNTRDNSQYWCDVRENGTVSSGLQTLIAAWKQGGDFDAALADQVQSQVYKRTSWYCLLSGMECFPEAKILPSDAIKQFEAEVVRSNKAVASGFYDHAEYLRSI